MEKKRKSRMGKGLDTIIPKDKLSSELNDINKSAPSEEVLNKTIEIAINKIQPNRNQPRKTFNEDAMNELIESVKQYGIVEPLIVRKENNGFYDIIAGERRWRAAKAAGLKKVPVIIKDYNDQEVMEIALIENVQREDLNPIEEAEAYDSLINEFDLTQKEVAEKLSKSRSVITNALRLLKLDDRVRRMVVEEKLTSGHARTLLGIEDKEAQYKAAVKVFDENLSVRETEKLVKKINEASQNNEKKSEKKKRTDNNDDIYRKYEEVLKENLGTKVIIKNKRNGKGKIEIEYYSNEDFEKITDLLKK